jgi:hypothetical protein
MIIMVKQHSVSLPRGSCQELRAMAAAVDLREMLVHNTFALAITHTCTRYTFVLK